MLRLAGKLLGSVAALALPSSMMALNQTSSSLQTCSDLHSLISHLFSVTLQGQVSLHRAEEQYSSLTGIYLFHITSPEWADPLFWTVDLSVGQAYKGKPKSGHPPLTTYLIDAHDLVELLNGRLNTAHAYLSGKLKLLGNTAAAFKFQHFINENLKHNQSTLSSVANPNMNSPQHLLSSIPTSGLKCDVIFELIKSRLAAESALVSSVPPFVVQVNVLKSMSKQPIASWTIDTRTPGGLVYRADTASSSSKSTTKVDATLSIEDDDYIALLFGRLNPQRAFMKGLVKVRGNILLLQRLDQLWNRLQKTRTDPELPLLKELLLNTQLQPGLFSETVFFELIARLARAAPGSVIPASKAVRFSITKDGSLEAQWLLATNPEGHLLPVKHHNRRLQSSGLEDGPLTPIPGPSDLELVMEDDDLALLTRTSVQSFDEAITSNRVHTTGDRSLLPKLAVLFQQPPPAVLKAKL